LNSYLTVVAIPGTMAGWPALSTASQGHCHPSVLWCWCLGNRKGICL